jgi:hypothetical protein
MSFVNQLLEKFKAPRLIRNFPWAGELTGLDDISVIERATLHLNASLKNGAFENELYLHAMFAIDEKLHITVERITAHYINITNIGVELEDRFNSSLFLYHRQTFLVYLTLIERLAPIAHPSLLIMMGRAMNSAMEMIKWRYYNFQSSPANVWLQLSKLYLTGKSQSLLEAPVTLYDEATPTTLSTLYVQACMLGTIETLSFKRQQIYLVCKMLAKWAPKTAIANQYDEKKHLFYVDTAKNVPAKRIRNFKPEDSYLYWCFTNVNSKVDLCLSSIELNISPKQLALEEFIDNKYFLPTLEVLRTEWSRTDYKRQRRNEERVKSAQSATTAYGFKDTCYQIKQYENLLVQRGAKPYQGEKSFDERIAAHYVIKSRAEANVIYVDMSAGYSNIVDESTRGLGLQISKQANEVSIGMMVGVSVKEKKYGTRVGIIRSIKPIGGNELQIGVEVLSRNAFYTEAKNMSIKNAKVSGDHTVHDNAPLDSRKGINFSCLFLPEEPGISSQETLIIPKLEHNNYDMFKVNILGSNVGVRFTETLERHEDWIRVAFAKIE